MKRIPKHTAEMAILPSAASTLCAFLLCMGDSTDRDNSRVPTFFAQGVCHFYFGLEELIQLAVICCANRPVGLCNEFGVIAYVSTELKEAYFFQLYYSVSRGG